MSKQQRTFSSVSLNFWSSFSSLKVPELFSKHYFKATVMPNTCPILASFSAILYVLILRKNQIKNYVIYHTCSNNNILYKKKYAILYCKAITYHVASRDALQSLR